MKHLFVINPVAGGKQNRTAETEAEIRRVADTLTEPYEIYITREPMDAARKVASDADIEDALRVYACGGDGTLNECINGAAGRGGVAVTHYPCGTGNDFIRTFGSLDAERFRDLAALTRGEVRPLDLIDCGVRYGINICSVGIDARIGADVHKYSRIPLIGGATGYVVSLVFNLIKGIKREMRISAGDRTFSGDFSLMCACNGRYYGGGFNPVPDAMPDDGVMETLIVAGVSRFKFLRLVGKYAKGCYRELSDTITHVRGGLLELSADTEFAVNIDGEIIYTKDVCFKIMPGGVNFLFPSGMEFFNQEACE